MRALFLLCILAAVSPACFSQQEPEGAPLDVRIESPIDSMLWNSYHPGYGTAPDAMPGRIRDTMRVLKFENRHYRRYTCDVRLITPAGRFVGWTTAKTDEPIIVRDSVVTTGCPVCGSDRCFERVFIEGISLYKPESEIPERERLYRGRYQQTPWVPYVMDLASIVGGMEVRRVYGKLNVCRDCGTVYHGRRK